MKVKNPVLKGFNPDPSFVNANGEYYIATSTFEWFPGVCIHHSKDLVNWEIITYALDNEYDMDLTGIDTACGIWAPNLTYNKGIFYLVYTIVYTNRSRYKDTHNFLVTAPNIKGPWSKPVLLNKTGFDPSLFHEENGDKWLVNMVLDYRIKNARFGGVTVQRYDEVSHKLSGSSINIFSGSEKGTTEGPNLFKYEDFYYLVVAEGGTGPNHCVTVARSKNIEGPYEENPNNPIITSAGKSEVQLKRAGHGQVIQGNDGNWYMAHLCSRQVEGYSITGRETAIQNIEWTEDKWFKLKGSSTSPADYFTVSDDIQKTMEHNGFVDFKKGIPLDYMTLRKSKKTCNISVIDGHLMIEGGNSLSSKYNQSLLARRQQDLNYDFSVAMRFKPENYNNMSGLVVYYNYDNYYYLRMNKEKDGYSLAVTAMINKEIGESKDICIYNQCLGEGISLSEDSVRTSSILQNNNIVVDNLIFLKVEVRYNKLKFYYSMDNKEYTNIGNQYDMTTLSDEKINGNGFTGAMVGVACHDLSGNGSKSEFLWLNYEGKDDI